MNGVYLQIIPDGRRPVLHLVYMADVTVLNRRFALGLGVTEWCWN